MALMCLMTAKVQKLHKRSRDQMDEMKTRVLLLSETLIQLQKGKVWTCAMCRVNWVQQGNLCFMFSDLELSWQASKNFCVDEVSILAVVETKEEMNFLKHESHRFFVMHRGQQRYHRFWINLEYTNSTSLTLRDGTRVPVALALHAGPNPCVYLRHGKLYAMSCHKMYNFICKTKVEFGLN
ncbi:C-type lectin domain family 2 member D5-like isoform X2 [Paroedura picta]